MNTTLLAVVAVALFFDFTNGFHDAANAIATSVSTRALSPRIAVVFAGLLNFVGAFVSLKVATTIGKGIVDSDVVTLEVVLAGVTAAVAWNLTTWLLGLPTSSSHALIGGVMGAAIANAGFGVVDARGLVEKVLLPSLLSPLLGIGAAVRLVVAIMWMFRGRSYRRTTAGFRRLQVVSAGFVAVTHGTNDAQKTMGVIALALVAANPNESFHVPVWVIVSSALAIAFGTYAGGWRIVRTLGQRVVKLQPQHGFAAETATAAILWTTASFGFPVSTTQTISGSVLGAGAVQRFSAVRWGIAANILAAWLFTLPAAALVGALMQLLTRAPAGQALVFALALAISLTAFAAAAHVFERPRGRRPSLRAALTRLRPSPDISLQSRRASRTVRAADKNCGAARNVPHTSGPRCVSASTWIASAASSTSLKTPSVSVRSGVNRSITCFATSHSSTSPLTRTSTQGHPHPPAPAGHSDEPRSPTGTPKRHEPLQQAASSPPRPAPQPSSPCAHSTAPNAGAATCPTAQTQADSPRSPAAEPSSQPTSPTQHRRAPTSRQAQPIPRDGGNPGRSARPPP